MCSAEHGVQLALPGGLAAGVLACGLLRRARPALGTVVGLGLRHPDPEQGAACLEQGFVLLDRLEALLSRFRPGSDVSRFNALPGGATLALQPATQRVMAAAAWLRHQSGGRFDPTLGSGPQGWQAFYYA